MASDGATYAAVAGKRVKRSTRWRMGIFFRGFLKQRTKKSAAREKKPAIEKLGKRNCNLSEQLRL